MRKELEGLAADVATNYKERVGEAMKLFIATAISIVLNAHSAYSADAPKENLLCRSDIANIVDALPNLAQAPADFWGWQYQAYGYYNDDGMVDFCRVINYKTPLDQYKLLNKYKLACTLGVGDNFGDEVRGKTVCSSIVDIGGQFSRAWTDFDGDNRMDFCAVGVRRIWCYLAAGNKFSKKIEGEHDIVSEIVFPNGKWADFNGDGKADFCSRQKMTPPLSELTCILSETSKFGRTVRYVMPYDLGEAADWVDINVDGKVDYCGIVGQAKNLVACHLSTGETFTTVRYEFDTRTAGAK
jgi:hypothetical protein